MEHETLNGSVVGALASDWFVLFFRVLHVSWRQRVLFAMPRYNLKKLFIVFNFFVFSRFLSSLLIPAWFCVAKYITLQKHSAFDFHFFFFCYFSHQTKTQSQVEPSPKICVNFIFVILFSLLLCVRWLPIYLAFQSLVFRFHSRGNARFNLLGITHVWSQIEHF